MIPGQVWFVAKAFSMVFLFLWVRATWPRLRVDQIMGFAWKGLFPLALLNMFLIATEVVVLQDSTGVVPTDELWIMAGVNWLVTILAIIVAANVLGQRKLRPEERGAVAAGGHGSGGRLTCMDLARSKAFWLPLRTWSCQGACLRPTSTPTARWESVASPG